MGQTKVIEKTVSLSSGAIKTVWTSFLLLGKSLPGNEANTEEDRIDRLGDKNRVLIKPYLKPVIH